MAASGPGSIKSKKKRMMSWNNGIVYAARVSFAGGSLGLGNELRLNPPVAVPVESSAVDPDARPARVRICEVDESAGQVLEKGRFDGKVIRYVVLASPKSELMFAKPAVSAPRLVVLGQPDPEMAPLVLGADASPTAAGAEFVAFLDPGACIHATGEKKMLKGYVRLTKHRKIRVPDGRLMDIVGVGSIDITTPECSYNIPKVFYVEGLGKNLQVSVGQLRRDHGLLISRFHDSGTCKIMQRSGDDVGEGILQDDGKYKLTRLLVPEN